MAARATIGIPFDYQEVWIGGTYYIRNLVASLNLLPESERPDVWMLSNNKESFDYIVTETNYPHLYWQPPSTLKGIDGGVSRRVRWLSRLTPSFLKHERKFDVIFPHPLDWGSKQTVCWIPDFQDKRMPEFFDDTEIAAREKQHRDYIKNFRHLVFSSRDAEADFRHFYPEAATRTHVVHFATFLPDISTIDHQAVRQRHGLPERYFYCPNQFWIHKNHKTVIEAVARLAEAGIVVTMAFSGKEHDHRAPDHTQNLKDLARQRGVADQVRFLGFLPRDEQLSLFANAVAIVQPSLFEGWSTVIEDAKALGQYVIAADLAVNREQIDTNVDFFDPLAPLALAECIGRYAQVDPSTVPVTYESHQRAFAQDFMSVVDEVRADRRC